MKFPPLTHLGGAMALVGVVGIGPIVEVLTTVAGNGVDFLVETNVLPLVSVIIEPAKVLFLNNAINHGVLGPLAVAESVDTGQSVLFMIETNPGPGLGILIAVLLFGHRAVRPTVPSAMIIHFLGGIHEIYFPYVLMKPRLVLAAIGGGMAGVVTASMTGAGLVSVPSPGSIFAYMAVTPRGGHSGVLLFIAVATVVTFGIAAVLLRFGKSVSEPIMPPTTNGCAATEPVTMEQVTSDGSAIIGKDVTKVLVACAAGMGSSVMLATLLRGKLEQHGVKVEHVPVNEIPPDAQVVLTHENLEGAARTVAPDAVVKSFATFIGDPVLDEIEAAIREGGELRG